MRRLSNWVSANSRLARDIAGIRSGRSSSRAIAPASADESPGGTIMPLPPSRTATRQPREVEVITGRPMAMASISACGIASPRAGSTKT